ncbi:MAG TPA: BrnA antitoxin family protein [Tianweitania sediminis]|jgi:uncharacterized protein (DUF4415 family)|nr:BrnA antitoxin family protein [Tianweitania sediminis]
MQKQHDDRLSYETAGGEFIPLSPSTPDRRVEMSVELDADVAEKIKALGPDWQEKVNLILRTAKL